CGSTSVENHDILTGNTTFEVFPNPASGLITAKIFSNENDVVLMKLFTIQGQKVLEKTIRIASGENSFSFNSDDFTPGLYLLMLQNNNQEIITKKIEIN
nr:T9SS type A sorting domain-containing protein [Bacteroidota bacterium]